MIPLLIKDLSDPASLPEPTENVTVVQTHISIVLVADNFAYKIKKPVDFGFLDFLTLKKRAYYCQQEVTLNRRLAKDVYIEVIPIWFDGKKYSMVSKQGEVAEYAVKMKRIPEEKLMKWLYEKGKLTGDHLKKVAQVLAKFHSTTLRNPEIDEYGEPERFKVNTDENFDQIRRYCGVTIDQKELGALERWTTSFYTKNGELFHDRIQTGKIRDCHGDLHMEHVCFTENLSIIDCIEFNDRFRYSDAVADIAFLLMDLEYHGGKAYSTILWNEYKGMTRDRQVESLLTFYKLYRAIVRGKVNSFQVDDASISKDEKEKARERAKKYFRLAYSYIA